MLDFVVAQKNEGAAPRRVFVLVIRSVFWPSEYE